MADEDKIGTVWSDEELDFIVADYFSMLEAELRGDAYVKSAHRAVLMEQIGRTNRSVEFKHMNISAVLRELGMPWIEGYKPKLNFQRTIFDAIDRYLSENKTVLEFEPNQPASGLREPFSLFIEAPPALIVPNALRPEGLERLVRKFDPVERDFRNRALGKAGEQMVFDFECQRLKQFDRQDLARKVRWVAEEDGDGAGYDILSFDHQGNERLIEVKTTCGSEVTPFYLTRNERLVAEERSESFRLYRLYRFSKGPRLFELVPPLEAAVRLEPITYRASFN